MKTMMFYDKNKNTDRFNSLANAFAGGRDKTNINTGTINPVQSDKKSFADELAGGISSLTGLGNSFLDSGAFNKADSTGNHLASSSVDMGLGDNENLSFLGSGSPNGLSFLGLGKAGLNSAVTALNGGSFKDDVPQAFFGINKNDSDVNQAINGALSGAQLGAAFGPIGMAVGGALGLGSSFLDDIF